MQPPVLLRLGPEVGEHLGVARVGCLVAKDDGAPHRGALDLVHQPQLYLAVTLASELRRKVRGPELLLLDLLLQGPDRAHEPLLVRLEYLERVNLVAHEAPHPLELGLELRFGRKIPRHLYTPRSRSWMPSSIMPVMVVVSP